MKKLVAGMLGSILVAGGIVSVPALAQEARKTELVELDGQTVDSLLMRYAIEAVWVVDTQHILLRDTYRDHYVVTMKEPCLKLDMDRNIKFFPALNERVYDHKRYEARDAVGPPCDVARIEQVEQAKANAMRASMPKNG